ncbi:hypothetical protein J2797_006311 [Paraburkholderia terricola]|uniref:hypothetical protein n=1 Tax=Paraburkholderia terricola TaxID=169427 RepID=UPI00286505D7|nr:hypothetical protein [Paraburkholderia terricola]MDR6496384.1 hypothetical protein [Paraburkholderia terricola]
MKVVAPTVMALPFLIGSATAASQSPHVNVAPLHAGATTIAEAHVTTLDNNQLLIKIEPVGPLKLDSGAGAPWWTYLIPAVGPILSGALAFMGVVLGLRIGAVNTLKTTESAQKNNEAAIWQKANETELRDIQAKLDGFYIPYRLKSKANQQFAQDIRSRQDGNYRMLVKLFDRQWRDDLTAGDKKLVELVSNNAEDLRALIESKSGLVDDKVLPYLSRASAHYRILNLAFKFELGDDPEPFKPYVYPRELDGVLSLEIARLKSRIDQLRANPGSCPPQLDALDIPPDLLLKNWVDPDGRLRA